MHGAAYREFESVFLQRRVTDEPYLSGGLAAANSNPHSLQRRVTRELDRTASDNGHRSDFGVSSI